MYSDTGTDRAHKKTVAEATVQSHETKPLGDSIASYATLTEMYSAQN